MELSIEKLRSQVKHADHRAFGASTTYCRLAYVCGVALLLGLPIACSKSTSRPTNVGGMAPLPDAAPLGGSRSSGGTGSSILTFGGAGAKAGSSSLGGTTLGPAASTEDVHFIGRVDKSDPNGPRFAWPGTGLVARVQGARIDLNLTDTTGNDLVEVSIDGATPKKIQLKKGSSKYALATDIANSGHEVLVIKRTETQIGTIQFRGFDQQNVAEPSPFLHSIEFVGDSITAGYGIDVTADPSCALGPDENAYESYAAITARSLSANYSLIAWSGIGVYRNFSGETADTMPVIYFRALGDVASSTWDFSSLVAEVVIVNLGTNDFALGDPGNQFVSAYSSFISWIRSTYPEAFIICALGPMLTASDLATARNYLQNVVKTEQSKGDGKISFLEFATQDSANDYGCDGHPSAATHKIMATQLTQTIRSLAGW